MSQAGLVGAGRMQVSPAELDTISGHAARIGGQLLDSLHQQAAGLGSAGRQGGWATGAALGRCAGEWQSELSHTAAAVCDVGDRLASTAQRYRTTEQANARRFSDIHLPGQAS